MRNISKKEKRTKKLPFMINFKVKEWKKRPVALSKVKRQLLTKDNAYDG